MKYDPFEPLRKFWGYAAFRPLQEDIIRAILDKKDVLALLPTGGGKSICYQVPAVALPGLCLVVSPLIALMKDQVEQLRKKGIPAYAIYSGMGTDEVNLALDNCASGHAKLLYLSPERLSAASFRDRLRSLPISFAAIDEAHCISEWGYDFRPSYLKIASIRDAHPEITIAAFTATATTETRADIVDKLELKNPQIFTASFNRPNLSYLVYKTDDKYSKLIEILKKIKGAAVVYVRNRRATADIARFLQDNGIAADFYHAGLPMPIRNSRQESWIKNNSRVIVATNAFGMGIDKPDVRVVVHMDVPDSLEAYYQEAGRAGRDTKKAFAVLLFRDQDIAELEKKPDVSFPEIPVIREVYNAICNFLSIPIGAGEGISYDFELTKFLSNFKFDALQTVSSLRVLENEGLISFSENVFLPSRIHFPGTQEELYRFRVESNRFDHLIKTILRSTEGSFDDFVSISEADLAKKAGVKTNELVNSLKYLHQLGILHYQARKDAPQLTLLTNRIPESAISFDFKHYRLRKQKYAERIQSIISYATETDHCRVLKLMQYFNEILDARCGNCDYCRKRNKLDLNELEFERYASLLLDDHYGQVIPVAQIMESLNEQEKAHLTETIRWLLERGEIILNERGEYLRGH